jgi:putative selenate reductase molybdopterin-binding subunit
MHIHFTINDDERDFDVASNELLLTTLRRAGLYSVKHGCETGECGACAVVLDGQLVNSCTRLVQQAFAETGAIQCGYCTPAMVLAAKELLGKTLSRPDARRRCATRLGGVLCRCTGYVKPVEAVLRAAAMLRGESGAAHRRARRHSDRRLLRRRSAALGRTGACRDRAAMSHQQTKVAFFTFPTVDTQPPPTWWAKPEMKVDAVKLVKGKPVFADDIDLPGMLHAALLTSPHAHARITRIDASKARALPGVHAVLTYKDVPRVIYASGGQTWPNPHPWDQVSSTTRCATWATAWPSSPPSRRRSPSRR